MLVLRGGALVGSRVCVFMLCLWVMCLSGSQWCVCVGCGGVCVCVCSEGRLCMCWVLSSVFPYESEERVPRWFLKGVCLHVGF